VASAQITQTVPNVTQNIATKKVLFQNNVWVTKGLYVKHRFQLLVLWRE